jgi:hypothetical protein
MQPVELAKRQPRMKQLREPQDDRGFAHVQLEPHCRTNRKQILQATGGWNNVFVPIV